MDKKKEITNWTGLFIIFSSAICMAFVGYGLVPILNQLNHSSIYGQYASYTVACLLFWLLTYKVNIIKKKHN